MSEQATPSPRPKPPGRPAIACNNVNFTYHSQGRETHALADVNLEVAQGAFCGIAGHTGSGKSTLLALLSALTKPASGRIIIDGLDLSKRKNRRTLHTRVGLALQYPEKQLFAPTVAQDVTYGLKNAGIVEPELTRRARMAMAAMGLDFDHYAQRSPFELSGGEQRRVALAGVLATQPRVLLLDEPTAGLDPRGRAEILDYIKAVNAAGVTVVMVSHSMDDLAELCTQVVVLKDGHIVLNDTPQRVFDPQTNRQILRDLNLELPHVVDFADSLACRLEQATFARPRQSALHGEGGLPAQTYSAQPIDGLPQDSWRLRNSHSNLSPHTERIDATAVASEYRLRKSALDRERGLPAQTYSAQTAEDLSLYTRRLRNSHSNLSPYLSQIPVTASEPTDQASRAAYQDGGRGSNASMSEQATPSPRPKPPGRPAIACNNPLTIDALADMIAAQLGGPSAKLGGGCDGD